MEMIDPGIIILVVISLVLATVAALLPSKDKNDFFRQGESDSIEGDDASELAVLATGMRWKRFEVTLNKDPVYIQSMRVPLPVWNYWVLQQNEELRAKIIGQIVAVVSEGPKGKILYPTSMPALRFLRYAEQEIVDAGGRIFTFSSEDGPPEEMRGQSLTLFDLSLNSGRTLAQSAKYFSDLHWDVGQIIVVVDNDLMYRYDPVGVYPEYPYYRVIQGLVRPLYKASDVVERWEGARLLSEVRIIQEVWNDDRAWRDVAVKKAVRRIYQQLSEEDFLTSAIEDQFKLLAFKK